MTDINKQIEKEAIKHVSACLGIPESNIEEIKNSRLYHSFIAGYKKGAYDQYVKWEHSSRWRKVSEELPEMKDENYFINIKRYDNKFRIDTICVFAEMEYVKGYLEFNNVDSWKPID